MSRQISPGVPARSGTARSITSLEYSPNAGRERAAVRSTHRRAQRRARPTDFAAVNRAALVILQSLLERWLPGGRTEGASMWRSIPAATTAASVHSKLNMRTGRWADFAISGRARRRRGVACRVFGRHRTDRSSRALGGDARHRGPPWPMTQCSRLLRPASDRPRLRQMARGRSTIGSPSPFPTASRYPMANLAGGRGCAFPPHSLGKPTACFWFHNEAGQVICGECRFEIDPPADANGAADGNRARRTQEVFVPNALIMGGGRIGRSRR